MDDIEVAGPPRWARIAGTVGWMAPILGFVPLHLPWIFGIPFLAHPKSFDAWYHGRSNGTESLPDGILGIPAGGFYLAVLMLLAILGGILSLGLISPWGLVYPHWIPLLGGRRVPAWFPLTPTVLGSALMIGYALTLPVQIPRAIAEASPADPFTITGALVGLPIFLAWMVALPLAGWSYFRRTRQATLWCEGGFLGDR
ncbi:hypothetical protein O7635_05810 [Asanoa sp. WMMD1127]|uniref:hypothetical protein n=1 Tax=Asanoa sp. WMMD1127 TaxID=3016107 RepID=UPI00241682F0|nr:hypothetical protein [Asanoa sp. WMMD1127]MDG4821369.1 hypothetical protein [Asanoa sp. WMMD1127]